ncbi:MAG TPA: hypothetical protein VMF89_08050 [Polyangiales bacterium]|nr:hypothetical protein [Polyangiales bacterium]
MMYTRERLLKAVRDAGRGGRPFTLGEVRGELGLKTKDKREQKRFRSRFRECSQILGDNLERLGPNTFRLKAGYAEPVLVASPKPAAAKSALRAAPPPPPPPRQKQQPLASENLSARVSVPPRPGEEEDLYTQKRRPREQISFVAAEPSARQLSFSDRISSWFGRSRHGHPPDTSTASTALSRLAVELQPKAASFEYRWIDGKLQVQRAADK